MTNRTLPMDPSPPYTRRDGESSSYLTDQQIPKSFESIFDEYICNYDEKPSTAVKTSIPFDFDVNNKYDNHLDKPNSSDARHSVDLDSISSTYMNMVQKNSNKIEMNEDVILSYSKEVFSQHMMRLNRLQQDKVYETVEKMETSKPNKDVRHSSSSPSFRQSIRSHHRKKTTSKPTIQQRRWLSYRNKQDLNHTSGSSSRISNQTQADKISSLSRSPRLTDPNGKSVDHSPYNDQNPPDNSRSRRLDKSFHHSNTEKDLLNVIMESAIRLNPVIDIGTVNLSCSFTIVAAHHPDQPILYCSDKFCQMTGYEREEIIGRNCRFLQSPDGIVEKGKDRQYTDNAAIRLMKIHLICLEEYQTCLLNYRRDGSPFMNQITILPFIQKDMQTSIFLVGLQVELTDQAGTEISLTPKTLYDNLAPIDGISKWNRISTEVLRKNISEEGILAQEIAEVMANQTKEENFSASPWANILLKTHHDLVYVLSLKGVFLYVSPSVEVILGYSAEELLGKSIQEFCHPADIVLVMRELKDSTSNANIKISARQWEQIHGTFDPLTKGGVGQNSPKVNLIMRMKQKNRGYEWMESVGKIHLEQVRGRKVVISTARKCSSFTFPSEVTNKLLNQSDPGIWFKVSINGIILSTLSDKTSIFQSHSATSNLKSGWVGKHLKDFINREALNPLLSALSSNKVTVVPHLMSKDIGSPFRSVISTVIPPIGASKLSLTFIYMRNSTRANLMAPVQADYLSRANQSAQVSLKMDKSSSENLSVFPSGNLAVELQILKAENFRLLEKIRSLQR